MSDGAFTHRISEHFLRDRSIPTAGVITRLLIYDFTTGETPLLRNHWRGIDEIVVREIGTDRATLVWVGGMASRAGSERLNRFLAHQRAHNTARYIQLRAPQVLQGRNSLIVRSFGETNSIRGDENDAYRRSVLIVVCRSFRPVPAPAPRRSQQMSGNPFFNKFKINLVAAWQGGEGVAVGNYEFIIDYDRETLNPPEPNPVRYELLGVGGDVVSFLPFGVEGGRVWNKFTAPRNCTTQDFAGRASIVSGSMAAGIGVGSSDLRLFPSRGDDILISNFQSELSMGAGFSAVYGPFLLGWDN